MHKRALLLPSAVAGSSGFQSSILWPGGDIKEPLNSTKLPLP